ncbi:MAG TPA: hypothetical protein VM933_07290, partial [Acidimicrobiales bacterium]|nr:hypothetical protein [Acidimicrobiales bacterium]
VPASGFETDAVSISEGQRIVKSYPGMGPGVSTENETAQPDLCENAPTCTVVPLNVVLPADFDPDTNDFAVQVRLDWVTSQLPNNQGQANDLDLFVWDRPQGDAPLGRSVGTVVPEIVGLAQPQKGAYNIVVRNSLGNNVGFKLTFRWIDGRLVAPEESQEPSFTPFFESGESSQDGPTPPPDPDAPTPSRGSFGSTRPSGTGSFSSGGFPSIVPDEPSTGVGSTSGMDDEFTFGGQTDIRALLGAGVGDPQGGLELFSTRTAATGPAKPPSPLLFWFWLGAVPLILLGALAVLMLRRRPDVLSLRVPVASPST